MTYIRSSRLYQLYVVLLSRPFFRSRDRDRVLDKMNSSLEIMVSRLQQFLILVTEHSLEVATKYSNRATGDGRHQACCLEIKTYRYSRSWDQDLGHQVSRPTETETWTKWTRVHSSLETMVSRSQHWLYAPPTAKWASQSNPVFGLEKRTPFRNPSYNWVFSRSSIYVLKLKLDTLVTGLVVCSSVLPIFQTFFSIPLPLGVTSQVPNVKVL